MSIAKRLPLALVLLPLLATGCAHDNEITAIGGSIGQEVKRTSCPAVGVAAYTGTVTLFNPVVYLVSGFRWSFFGTSDVSVGVSLGMTLVFLLVCVAIVSWIFRTGYRLRN